MTTAAEKNAKKNEERKYNYGGKLKGFFKPKISYLSSLDLEDFISVLISVVGVILINVIVGDWSAGVSAVTGGSTRGPS